MKKGLVIACLLLMCCLTLLFGCDPYANMKLKLSASEISIEMVETETTENTNSEDVIASISGVDSKVSKRSYFTTQDSCVQITTSQNGVNTLATIKALSVGSATIKVTTEEGNKVKYITVKVTKKPTSMATNTTYKPAVSVNGTLQLNSKSAVTYLPSDANLTDVSYSLVGTYSGVSITPEGLLTVGATKPAVNEELGYSEIKVQLTNKATNLSCVVSVRVVQEVTSLSELTLKLGDQVVNEDSEINILLNNNATRLLYVTVNNASENYNVSISSNNTSVVKCFKEENAITTLGTQVFKLEGMNIGDTTLKISVGVKGYESYASFVFEKDISVKYVPTAISLNASFEQNTELKIFDSYSSLAGTQINVDVAPYGVKNADARIVVSTDFSKLTLVYSDGSVIGINSDLTFDSKQWVVVPNGITIYARLNSEITNLSAVDDVVLTFKCINKSNELYAGVSNTMTAKSYVGVSKIESEQYISTTNSYYVAKTFEKTLTFGAGQEFCVKDSKGSVIDIANTDLSLRVRSGCAEDIVSISGTTLTGLKTGITYLTLQSSNGIAVSFKVQVVVPFSDAVLWFPNATESSSTVSYEKIDGENTYNGTFFTNKIIQGDLKITKSNSEETESATISTIVEAGKMLTSAFKLQTSVSATDTPQSVSIKVSGFDNYGAVKTVDISFNITVVKSLTNFVFTKSEYVIYEPQSLGADALEEYKENQTQIELKTDSTLLNESESELTWSGLNANSNSYFTVENGATSKAKKITALEWSDEPVNDKIFQISVSITEYGRTYTAVTNLVIKKAVQVESIVVTNLEYLGTDAGYSFDYKFNFDARNGLGEQADSNTLTLKTTVLPKSAKNKALVYSSSNSDVVTINANGKIVPVQAGTATILVCAEDSATKMGEQIIYLKQVKIEIMVSNGTKENPFAISNSQQLQNINSSEENLGYYYRLDNHISLSAEFTPVGSLNNLGFSGGLSGRYYLNEEKTQFVQYEISGFSISSNTLANVGLFSCVNEGATVDGIVLNGGIALTNSNSKNVGFIAGVNNGTISNCKAFGDIAITNNLVECVGGIAGANNGTISASELPTTNVNNTNNNFYGNISVSTTNTEANTGGIVGKNLGTIENQISGGTISGLNNVGGIAGINEINKTISTCESTCQVKGTDKIGGIAGNNAGTLDSCKAKLYDSFGNLTADLFAVSGMSNLGGIAGVSSGSISLCSFRSFVTRAYALLNADNGATFNYLGDIVCYNTVTTDKNVGGIAGINSGTIDQTYAIGLIQSAGAMVCGIVGTNNNTSGITDSYVTANSIFEGVTSNANISEKASFLDATKWNAEQTDLNNNKKEIVLEGISVSAVDEKENKVFEVTENPEILIFLNSGEIKVSDILTLDLLPSNADNKDYTILSSNSNVLQVNGEKIKAISEGKVTLIIYANANQSAKAEIVVYVTKGLTGVNVWADEMLSTSNNLIVNRTDATKIYHENKYEITINSETTTYDVNSNVLYDFTGAEADVLTIDENWIVTGLVAGDYEITITPKIVLETEKYYSLTDLKKTINLTVKTGAREIVLDKLSETISPIEETSVSVKMTTDLFDWNEEDESIKYEITNETENKIETSEESNIKLVAGNYGNIENTTNSNLTDVSLSYSISVKDASKCTTETTYKIKFYSSTKNEVCAELTLVVALQDIVRVGMEYFNTGSGPYNNETPTNIITPAVAGVLKVELFPIYSQIDYVTIESSVLNDDRLSFQQVCYVSSTENGQSVYKQQEITSSTFSNSGKLLLNTNFFGLNGSDGTNDGVFFFKTVCQSAVSEDAVYTVTISAKSKGSAEILVQTFNLIVKHLPTITTYNANNVQTESGYIAQTESTTVYAKLDGFTKAPTAEIKYNSNITSSNTTLSSVVDANGMWAFTVSSSADLNSEIEILFSATRYLNGINQEASATYTLTVVDFILTDINLTNDFTDMGLGTKKEIAISGTFGTGTTGEKILSLNDNKPLYLTANSDESASFVYESSKLYLKADKLTSSSSFVLKFGYYYDNNGKFKLTNASEENAVYTYEKTFAYNIEIQTSYDNPYPIYSQADFEAMEADKDYILMSDITLTSYEPISTAISSLDGNGKIINLNSFSQDILEPTTENATNLSINLGLFDTVSSSTILKNVRVCVDNFDGNTEDNNSSLDLTDFKTIKLGFLTAVNNGIINNCAVVSETSSKKDIVISNTNASASNSLFAMLVAENNKNISNSQVGISKNLGTETTAEYRISISAIGTISGFVCSNSGSIASSFVKNVKVINKADNVSSTKTAGFVANNNSNGTISYCYAEGYGDRMNKSYQGGALSTKGNAGGFVFTNYGKISNCYSNISLTGVKAQAGGFVYENTNLGTIQNAYSLSQIIENSTSTSLFSATNSIKINLNKGVLKNCYAFELTGNTASQTESANVMVLESGKISDSNSYYGFAFGGTEYSTWKMDNNMPTLANANTITNRVREISSISGSTSEDYQYSYSDKSETYGHATNPIIIRNVSDYQAVISKDGKSGTISKHIRIVDDIDFEFTNINSKTVVLSGGGIEGNGYSFNNISILFDTSTTEAPTAIGLFKKISSAYVANLNLAIKEVSAGNIQNVGALCGELESSTLSNIVVSGDKNLVAGKNNVGGVAGLVSGKNVSISNIKSGVRVNSSLVTTQTELEKEEKGVTTYSSYAGGIFGAIKNKTTGTISQLTVSGNVVVKGSCAGGVVGYVGTGVTINKVKFETILTQASTAILQSIQGSNYAGGLVAVLKGTLSEASLDFADEYVETANANITKNGTNSNLSNLFTGVSNATGGLVGYLKDGTISNALNKVDVRNSESKISGGVVGVADGGTIEYTYTTASVYANITLGTDCYVGGFIGKIISDPSLTNCLAINNWNATESVYNNSGIKFGYYEGGVVTIPTGITVEANFNTFITGTEINQLTSGLWILSDSKIIKYTDSATNIVTIQFPQLKAFS